MANEIKITLTIDGKQYTGGIGEATAANDKFVLSAGAIDAELASTIAQIKAMGAAAVVASQQVMGLGTSTEAAGVRINTARAATQGLANDAETTRASMGSLETAVFSLLRGFAGFAAGKLITDLVQLGIEFDALTAKVTYTAGSVQGGAADFAFIREEANRLGLDISAVAGTYTDFLNLTQGRGFTLAQQKDIFSTLSESAAKLYLSDSQTRSFFSGVINLSDKTKISVNDLVGSLGQSLPQVLTVVAKGLGVTTDELRKLADEGKITGEQILPALKKGLEETFDTGTGNTLDSTSAALGRFRNEAKTTGTVLSEVLDRPLRGVLNTLEGILDLARGEPFATLLKGGNPLLLNPGIAAPKDPLRGLSDLNTQVGSLANLANPQRPDQFQADFGHQLTDKDDQKRSEQLKQQLAYLNAQNETERAIYDITQGQLKDKDNIVKNERLAEAAVKDRQAAEKEAAKSADEQARDAERAAAAAQRQREQDFQSQAATEAARTRTVSQARTDSEILTEELRTGQALTGAARDLFILRSKGVEAEDKQLESQLEQKAALEEQYKTQVQIQQSIARADQDHARGGARNIRGAGRFGGDVDALQADATSDEKTRYEQQQSLYKDALDKKLITTQHYDQLIQDETLAHQQRLNEIDQAGVQARADQEKRKAQIAEAGLDIAGNVLGSLADLQDKDSKEGFERYKEFAVAQAIISTISGAVKAFTSLADIPYVGPYLGAAASAAALVAGYAQVHQIEAQQFTPRREFGGTTSRGGLVEVSEGGRPELFESAGRYYLASGANDGNVIAAKRGTAAGASGNAGVNITVNDNVGVSVRATQGADGSVTMDIVQREIRASEARQSARMVSDIRRGGSSISGAIESTYQLGRGRR